MHCSQEGGSATPAQRRPNTAFLPTTIYWETAAYVAHGDGYQLVVSDNPDLCAQLSTPTPACDEEWYFDCGGDWAYVRWSPYAYLHVELTTADLAGYTTFELPYIDPDRHVHSLSGELVVEPATSADVAGEFTLCNAKYGAFGAGQFVASFCAGGLPVD